jgi:hypothetical protein
MFARSQDLANHLDSRLIALFDTFKIVYGDGVRQNRLQQPMTPASNAK